MIVVEVLVKVTVFLLLVWCAAAALRRRSAAARHLVWAGGLVGVLLLPALELAPGWDWLPSWMNFASAAAVESAPLPIDPPADTSEEPTATIVASERFPADTPATTPSPSDAEPSIGIAGASPAGDAASDSMVAFPSLSTAQWLILVWSIGFALLITRLLLGWFAVRRIVRESEPCTDGAIVHAMRAATDRMGIRTDARLRLCTRHSGPMTFGMWRPVLVLPASARLWPRERLVGVLIHELAHVARRDCLTQLIGRLARAVHWFHPLAWLATRRLHLEQERACDDIVLRSGVRSSHYAEGLMEIASGLRPVPAAALVSTAIARPSELMARMQYLLDGGQPRGPMSRRWCGGLIVTVSVAAGVLGFARPADVLGVEDKQDKQDKPEKTVAQDRGELARRLVGLLDLKTHRDQAIQELASMGTPAIPALREALKNRNAIVVEGAVSALMKSSAPELMVASVLRRVLADTEQTVPVRLKCAGFLRGYIDRDPDVFAAFMAVADESSDADLVLTVVNGLSASKAYKREVAEMLMRRRGSRDEELAEAFRDRVHGLIVELGEARRSRAASRELMTIRREAAPQLLEALRHPNPRVRTGVMRILTLDRPVDERVATELLLLINQQKWNRQERQQIATFLSKCLVDRPAVERVFKLLDATESPGRREMIEALTRAPGANRTHVVRSFGATAAWIDEPAALWIVEALQGMKADPKLRAQSLLRAADNESPKVVAAAIRALATVAPMFAPGMEKVDSLGRHAAAVVQEARKDFLAAREVRKRFELPSIVVADYSENRIVEFDEKGREIFSIAEVFGVWDVEVLANGNLLVTEFSVNRVSEVTRKNRVVWTFEDLKNPYDADRLKNGHTLICDTFGRRVIEVDKGGKVVWQFTKNVHPYDADRLPNGNTLIADAHADRLIEVDKDGKIVWEVTNLPNVHDVDRLPNGNTLVTVRMHNEVREIDKTGKTVWLLEGLSSPSDADRLPDGTTMVAENGAVRFFTPGGVVLWKVPITWAVEVNVSARSK